VTKFVAPFVMVAYGWKGVADVWGAGLALMAVVFFLFAKDDPELTARRAGSSKPTSWAEHFAPPTKLQVCQFLLYHFFVFKAFQTLALWMPHYLIDAVQIPIATRHRGRDHPSFRQGLEARGM
jgi:MFS transporter, NNP family, nitrate/nitrite transporter